MLLFLIFLFSSFKLQENQVQEPNRETLLEVCLPVPNIFVQCIVHLHCELTHYCYFQITNVEAKKLPKDLFFCNRDHTLISNLTAYNKTYFTKRMKERHPEWPQYCLQCEKSFWDGDLFKRGVEAHLCSGIGKDLCQYGLCTPCQNDRLKKAGQEKVMLASPVKDLLGKRQDSPSESLLQGSRKRLTMTPRRYNE